MGDTSGAPGPAARLRRATREIHERTEAEPFVVDLMAGRSAPTAYARLVGQLRLVYRALDSRASAVRPASPSPVAALLDPRLAGAAALDHDLRVLADGDLEQLGRPLPETEAYVARIEGAPSWPRLLAHHYVRYLGDLSGGQVIAAMLRRHYGIPDAALTFFAFDEIGAKGAFKAAYRAGLDAALADEAAYTEALDEALAAYEANRALFAALRAAA